MYRINIALTCHIVVIVLALQYSLKKSFVLRKKKTLLQQTVTISSVFFINL